LAVSTQNPKQNLKEEKVTPIRVAQIQTSEFYREFTLPKLVSHLNESGFNLNIEDMKTLFGKYSNQVNTFEGAKQNFAFQKAIFGNGAIFLENGKNIYLLIKRGGKYHLFSGKTEEMDKFEKKTAAFISSSIQDNSSLNSLSFGEDMIALDEKIRLDFALVFLNRYFEDCKSYLKSKTADIRFHIIIYNFGAMTGTSIEKFYFGNNDSDINSITSKQSQGPVLKPEEKPPDDNIVSKQKEAVPTKSKAEKPRQQEESGIGLAVMNEEKMYSQVSSLLKKDGNYISYDDFLKLKESSILIWDKRGYSNDVLGQGAFHFLMLDDSNVYLFLKTDKNDNYLKLTISRKEFEKEGFISLIKPLQVSELASKNPDYLAALSRVLIAYSTLREKMNTLSMFSGKDLFVLTPTSNYPLTNDLNEPAKEAYNFEFVFETSLNMFDRIQKTEQLINSITTLIPPESLAGWSSSARTELKTSVFGILLSKSLFEDDEWAKNVSKRYYTKDKNLWKPYMDREGQVHQNIEISKKELSAIKEMVNEYHLIRTGKKYGIPLQYLEFLMSLQYISGKGTAPEHIQNLMVVALYEMQIRDPPLVALLDIGEITITPPREKPRTAGPLTSPEDILTRNKNDVFAFMQTMNNNILIEAVDRGLPIDSILTFLEIGSAYSFSPDSPAGKIKIAYEAMKKKEIPYSVDMNFDLGALSREYGVTFIRTKSGNLAILNAVDGFLGPYSISSNSGIGIVADYALYAPKLIEESLGNVDMIPTSVIVQTGKDPTVIATGYFESNVSGNPLEVLEPRFTYYIVGRAKIGEKYELFRQFVREKENTFIPTLLLPKDAQLKTENYDATSLAQAGALIEQDGNIYAYIKEGKMIDPVEGFRKYQKKNSDIEKVLIGTSRIERGTREHNYFDNLVDVNIDEKYKSLFYGIVENPIFTAEDNKINFEAELKIKGDVTTDVLYVPNFMVEYSARIERVEIEKVKDAKIMSKQKNANVSVRAIVERIGEAKNYLSNETLSLDSTRYHIGQLLMAKKIFEAQNNFSSLNQEFLSLFETTLGDLRRLEWSESAKPKTSSIPLLIEPITFDIPQTAETPVLQSAEFTYGPENKPSVHPRASSFYGTNEKAEDVYYSLQDVLNGRRKPSDFYSRFTTVSEVRSLVLGEDYSNSSVSTNDVDDWLNLVKEGKYIEAVNYADEKGFGDQPGNTFLRKALLQLEKIEYTSPFAMTTTIHSDVDIVKKENPGKYDFVGADIGAGIDLHLTRFNKTTTRYKETEGQIKQDIKKDYTNPFQTSFTLGAGLAFKLAKTMRVSADMRITQDGKVWLDNTSFDVGNPIDPLYSHLQRIGLKLNRPVELRPEGKLRAGNYRLTLNADIVFDLKENMAIIAIPSTSVDLKSGASGGGATGVYQINTPKGPFTVGLGTEKIPGGPLMFTLPISFSGLGVVPGITHKGEATLGIVLDPVKFVEYIMR